MTNLFIFHKIIFVYFLKELQKMIRLKKVLKFKNLTLSIAFLVYVILLLVNFYKINVDTSEKKSVFLVPMLSQVVSDKSYIEHSENENMCDYTIEAKTSL